MNLGSKITLGLGLLCLVLAIVNLIRGEIPWEGAVAALLLLYVYARERHRKAARMERQTDHG
jgi:hypothetical protein